MTPAFLIILPMSGATSAAIFGVIDKLWIFIAIGIGSIIVEWLNKRKQPGNTDATKDEAESLRNSGTTTWRPAESPPAATSDWEEELRRLLGGKPPVAKPPPVPAPQPTTVPQPLRPVVIQVPKSVPGPGTGAPPVVRLIPPAL